MKRTRIQNSQAIKSAGYIGSKRQLQVEFSSGKIYNYRNIPQNLFERFMRAKDKGRFFNKNINNIFPYQKQFSRILTIPVKGYTRKNNGRKVEVKSYKRRVRL